MLFQIKSINYKDSMLLSFSDRYNELERVGVQLKLL